jgi:LuxR family maltose regulon positive regulatory protein
VCEFPTPAPTRMEGRAMPTTSATAIVEHALLVQSDGGEDAIPVGSAAWYAWLVGATAFAFRSTDGTFTAHKERRGLTQEYWKAYRRRAGRLHRAYLGRSEELTLDRLTTVAAELEDKLSAHAPASAAALGDTPAPADVAKDVIQEAPDPGAQDGSFRLLDSRSLSATPASAATDDAQSLHLLSTKLAIPASHTRLVPRARLVSRLDMAIAQEQKLILIAAPAGFGKTTMIAEWLTKLRIENEELRKPDRDNDSQFSILNSQFRVAWLALDDADNHLGQFLAYVIAALETVYPRIGTEAWALLRARAAHPPSRAILAILVNALVDPADRIVLVLDDYHAITLQAIHEALAFLLNRMPAHMHVMITTRADPPLPLARLRVRGQLTEVRAADLRFTPDEAAYLFMHVHRISLAPATVTTLEARTEGWAAGLQLAALALQQRDAADMSAFLAGFTGSHTYVFDYLADEVFQRQPDHVRSFLVQTAILGRLCGPLCAAVTGQDDAQTLLEDLDHANLFLIRLDDNRHWYRYHHLFQEFLRDHLERGVPAADQALLQQRASVWFEQHGPVGEAIEHALRAKAWSQALRCLTPIMVTQRFYDYYLQWPNWLAALPDAVLQADLTFCLRFAWVLVLTGHIEAAERPLGLAESRSNAVGNQPKFGEVLGIRSISFYFRGDFLGAMRLAQQALALLPPDMVEQRGIPTFILGMSDLFRGHVQSAQEALAAAHMAFQDSQELFHQLVVSFGRARAYQLEGQLHYAAALYQETAHRAGDATYLQMPAAQIYLGMLYYEWNDLAAAERALRVGITVGQRTGRGRYWPTAYSALARVCWVRGEVTEASILVERALEAAQLLDNPRESAEAHAYQAWLWLAQGNQVALEQWLKTRALTVDDAVPYERLAEYLMLVRIRLAQAHQAPRSVDLDAVVRLLNRLCQVAEADQRTADQIVILALLALAEADQGQPDHGFESLMAALTLAEPEGYVRTFVDQGASMRSLLLALRAHVSASDSSKRLMAYIDRLLAAFPHDVPATPSPSAPPDLLSERERAVLQLLAAGRSVQEIATSLVISAHTARTHVKNIYTKLDAHNRVQALARARALHLL